MFEGVNNLIDAPSFESDGNWVFSSSLSGRSSSFDAFHEDYVGYVQSKRTSYDPFTSTWGPWDSGYIRYTLSELSAAIDWNPLDGDQIRLDLYVKPFDVPSNSDTTLNLSWNGTVIRTFTRDEPRRPDGWIHFVQNVEGQDGSDVIRFDSVPGGYDSLANQTWLIDAVIVEFLTNPAHDFSGRALRWEKGWYQCDICGVVVPYSYTTRDVLAIEQEGYRVCFQCLDSPGTDDFTEEAADRIRRAAKTEYKPKPP